MALSDLGTRPGTGGDLPKQLATDVIDDVRQTATVMKLGRVVQTNTRDSRIPVLSQDVDAFWVNGDAGMKGVSAPQWASQSIIAEELAVIVPVPDAVIDDADMPIWAEVRPLLARAFARRLDAAALFGTNKPASWSPSLVSLATTAGATVESTEDPAADLLAAAELVANQELTPTASAVRNGWEFNASATRARPETVHGSPLDDTGRAFALSIAGMPIATKPVYWDNTKAEAIIADYTQCIIGLRQDLTFSMHRDGIISDSSGNVVTNLMQQDITAMRCVMRVGFHMRRPVIGSNTPTVPVAIVEPPA